MVDHRGIAPPERRLQLHVRKCARRRLRGDGAVTDDDERPRYVLRDVAQRAEEGEEVGVAADVGGVHLGGDVAGEGRKEKEGLRGRREMRERIGRVDGWEGRCWRGRCGP